MLNQHLHFNLYAYTAVNDTGYLVKGHIAARSPAQARQTLLDREIYLFKLCKRECRKMVKVSESLIAHFFQLLAQLLESGIDLGACFAVLKTSKMPQDLQDWMLCIERRVHEGQMLSQAFREDGRCDLPLCALIEAGEARGALAHGLRSALQFTQDRIDLRRSLHAKLAYPALLLILCLSIFMLFIFAIAPQLEAAMQMGTSEKPAHWAFVFSTWVRRSGHIAVASLAGGLAFTAWCMRRSFVRMGLSGLIVRLPVLGIYIHSGSMYWFFRVLAQLLKGKIDLARALSIALNAPLNQSLAQRLAIPLKKINSGETLSSAMEKSGLFSSLPIQLLTVGENAGTLDVAAENVARYFQHRRDERLKLLLNALQPALLVLIGAMIAVIGYLVLHPFTTLEMTP